MCIYVSISLTKFQVALTITPAHKRPEEFIDAMPSDSRRTRASPPVPQYSHYRDDLDSDLQSSADFANYTVHIPPTPDNQPMELSKLPSSKKRVEDQYASSSLFTGGYNLATRASLKEKVIESESSHPQMTGVNGSECALPGCDARVMSDERGNDVVPCECGFKICRDCYKDVMRSGDGICPGCMEAYEGKNAEVMKLDKSQALSKMERRLSMMKSASFNRSSTNEFDNNQWLFETKGSYGYGSAMWPKDDADGNSDGFGEPEDLKDKQWRPLTRKLSISAAILSPYR